VIALSVLVFLVNVIFTARRADLAPEDPWDARTLEWLTSSPPPEYNFAEIPIVTHRDEFWHRKYTEDDEGRLVKLPASDAAVIPRRRDPNEPHNIHMPSPSYWPFVLALGLPIIGYGFVFKWWWLLAIGALIAFFGLNAWTIEPASEEHH
jgi:cytochrome c oxidase subunit 1